MYEGTHFCLLKNIFVANAFIYPFSTHKQCILRQFMHNSTAMFTLKTLYPGGI
jgi:hypothetical protein